MSDIESTEDEEKTLKEEEIEEIDTIDSEVDQSTPESTMIGSAIPLETKENEDEETNGADQDPNAILSAKNYLHPPERKWVLPSFFAMVLVFFGYYWFTYMSTL